MIKKLKRQIAITLTILMSVIIIGVLVFVNVIFRIEASNSIYNRLEIVMQSINIKYFDRGLALNPFPMNYDNTSVVLLVNNNAFILNNEPNVGFNDEELVSFAQGSLQAFSQSSSIKGVKSGKYYYAKHVPEGTLVLVASNDNINERSEMLLRNSFLVGCAGLIISAWIATLGATLLVKPVQETIDNERAFVSDASHELKTPLAVITSNAEVLESEIGDNKWLTCIKSETYRMSDLIKSMLAISRLEKSTNRQTFTKVDFSSCINETVMKFEAQAFEKGVLISTEIQDDVFVHGSEEKLKQVVAILIDNAVKYVCKNGAIKVALKSRMGSAVLTITNTGSFIEKKDYKRVFERFYRADEARTQTQKQSYGLGLAIAKRIVEEHEGNISVASSTIKNDSGETQVTRFKVTI